eukprot:3313842-Amphidinium_carterae.1
MMTGSLQREHLGHMVEVVLPATSMEICPPCTPRLSCRWTWAERVLFVTAARVQPHDALPKVFALPPNTMGG